MRRVSLPSAASRLIVASILSGVFAEASETVRYGSDISSSHLTVEGTSTIHGWMVEGRLIRGELIIHGIELSSLWADSTAVPRALAATVQVEIPVESLKSDKSGLNKNMCEALKAQCHSLITYRLEVAEIQAGWATNKQDAGESRTVHTRGVLTVAGVDWMVDIPMQVKQLPEDHLEVSGETSLRMTEFGIEPPTAMR